jgi:hypothetical protein
MVIGILQFEIVVPHSESLKDKRRVVKSLKDRLHREHQVSVAEIGALDHQRIALLGLAAVSSSAPFVSGVLDRVVDKLRHLHGARLGDLRREIISGSAMSLPEGAGAEEAEADEAGPLVWSEEELADLERELDEAGDENAGPENAR